MTRRYLILAAVLMSGVNPLTRRVIQSAFDAPLLASPDLLVARDFESVLARGEAGCFASADIYDLTLIPGISERIAEHLLEERDPLLGSTDVEAALDTVTGVGTVTSGVLRSHLSFDRSCGDGS